MLGTQAIRALRIALVSVIVSLSPYVLWAQTVVNPRAIEFDPSPEHFVVDESGARVQEYRLSLYLLGQSAAADIVSLGKPTPDADGKIRFDLASVLRFALPPGVPYEARVAAIGPGGESESAPSNDFVFQTACSPTIAGSGQSFDASGGNGSVSVNADASCGWGATSAAPWLTITGGASGVGSGVVTFTAAPNTTANSRTGTLTIAGQTFTVVQAAGTSCSATVAPSSLLAVAAGGTGVVSITASTGCPWSASSAAPWLTIAAGAAGTGSGSVSLYAAPNSDTVPRTGTVTVAGQTVTVTQSAQSCTYSISGASQSVAAAGGSGSVGVTAATGCAWTGTSNDPWLTLTSGNTGTGNGTATFTATPNPGTTARTGTITIAGQTVTVVQAAAIFCSYAIGATSQSLPAAGGAGSVAVTTQTGCAWTGVPSADWVTVTAGVSGTGSGTVKYAASANATGATRTATLTIAGLPFTVTQHAVPTACSYALNPVSAMIDWKAGTGTVSVTSTPGCTWKAVSGAEWIKVTASSATKLTYTVAANKTATARTGTIRIGGSTFTVIQRAR